MTLYRTDKYCIGICADKTFKEGFSDNLNQYDFVYFDNSEYHYPTVFGIKIFLNNRLFKSAAVGSIGGGTGIHVTSTIVNNDRLLICCSDTIFCLSIPELTLLWKTQADQATCFEIFAYKDSYIIHGEFEITRLDKDGKILWQQSGADIFTTKDGAQNFILTEEFILVKDFENRTYKFDFNGTKMTDT